MLVHMLLVHMLLEWRLLLLELLLWRLQLVELLLWRLLRLHNSRAIVVAIHVKAFHDLCLLIIEWQLGGCSMVYH